MLNFWIEVGTVTIEIILIFYLNTGLYGQEKPLRKRLAIYYGLYWLLFLFASLLISASAIRMLILSGAMLLGNWYCYRIHWIRNIYGCLLYFLMNVLADVISGAFLTVGGADYEQLMASGTTTRVAYILIAKLLLLVLFYLAVALTKHEKGFGGLVWSFTPTMASSWCWC